MEMVDPRVPLCLVPADSRPTVFGKSQKEYTPLPAIVTPQGLVITRWRLSEEEKRKLIQGDDIYLVIWKGSMPLSPVRLSVGTENWSGDWDGQAAPRPDGE